jgi:Ca2+-binding RTX toxin-like protein
MKWGVVMAAALVLAGQAGAGGGPVVARGSAKGEVLRGGSFADRLYGRGGRDGLWGYRGNDLLIGGAGNDLLYAGRGSDRLAGGEGNDFADGGLGPDVVFGGAGRDELTGGPGRDHVLGGPGADILLGNAGNDLLDARDPGRRRLADCREPCFHPDLPRAADWAYAGGGDDLVLSRDGRVDGVVCESGFDLVVADRVDRVSPYDCERVLRR